MINRSLGSHTMVFLFIFFSSFLQSIHLTHHNFQYQLFLTCFKAICWKNHVVRALIRREILFWFFGSYKDIMGTFIFSLWYFFQDYFSSIRTFNVNYFKYVLKQLAERVVSFENLFASNFSFEFFLLMRL